MSSDAAPLLLVPSFGAPAAGDPPSQPLWLVTDKTLAAWSAQLASGPQDWLKTQQFQPERGRVLVLPSADGRFAGAVAGLGNLADANLLDPWLAAAIADRSPPHAYHLATALDAAAATRLVLGWLLGSYRFTRYRSGGSGSAAKAPAALRAQLVVPAAADLRFARSAAAALNHARDLINTPANDLGPEELAQACADLASAHGGQCEITRDGALEEHFPLIHAVGKGSDRAPRLVDCRWPRPGAPRVTLVGKGVCFDTGGLDIKASAGMLLMKKDMGGAACAVALAQMLLELQAPLQLRLLVAAVENSVDARAYRPGDVCRSRKGLTVEIGNTDAEGRLVLADALALADEEQPDLIIDLATLTGAARTALGPELPAVYGSDPELAVQLQRCGVETHDPVWPMPLWNGYDDELGSRIADLNNVSASPFAGSIIGALFLRRFVTATPNWLHLDLYAWNARDRPGRPVGAEAHTVRALYAFLRRRFG